MLTKDMSEATLVIERCVPRLDPSSHLVRARPFTIPRSLRRSTIDRSISANISTHDAYIYIYIRYSFLRCILRFLIRLERQLFHDYIR